MPGGVSSPVRAFKAVGRNPITVCSGQGPIVTDVDGNDYIDYVGSYGPLLLGHGAEIVASALADAVADGWTFGMPTERETTLARLVVEAIDGVELVRFVNSGTEAVMSAIRLARASTGKDKLIKCTGCYHGHADSLLVQAGSGATTFGTASSPGVPGSVTADTLLVPYNDLAQVRVVMEEHRGQVAAMVVEPIAGNMGCVPPHDGYLEGLRQLCDCHEVVLIFDEVMTGFRIGYTGAQGRFMVTPDLTCFGKVLGGGLPCAAYGGGETLMRQVAPDGPVYQAGTLSGNPLAMAAGIAMLRTLRDTDAYERLECIGAALVSGLRKAAGPLAVQIQQVGSMLSVFFSDTPVTCYEQAIATQTNRFSVFFGQMLDAGVMIPPSPFECWFISTTHDSLCLERTINAAERAFYAAGEVT